MGLMGKSPANNSLATEPENELGAVVGGVMNAVLITNAWGSSAMHRLHIDWLLAADGASSAIARRDDNKRDVWWWPSLTWPLSSPHENCRGYRHIIYLETTLSSTLYTGWPRQLKVSIRSATNIEHGTFLFREQCSTLDSLHLSNRIQLE